MLGAFDVCVMCLEEVIVSIECLEFGGGSQSRTECFWVMSPASKPFLSPADLEYYANICAESRGGWQIDDSCVKLTVTVMAKTHAFEQLLLDTISSVSSPDRISNIEVLFC